MRKNKIILFIFLLSLLSNLSDQNNYKIIKKKTFMFLNTANLSSQIKTSFEVYNKLTCIQECLKNKDCSIAILATIKDNRKFTCCVYSMNLLLEGYLIDSELSTIYIFGSLDTYLTHLWNFNNNLNNSILKGSQLLTNNQVISFSNDRFGNNLSSVYLNNQYLQAPDAIYFNGDFTISAWIKPFDITTNYIPLIDFGIDAGSHNVNFYISSSPNKLPYLENCNINNIPSQSAKNFASKNLEILKWQHLAFTLNGLQGTMYLDGNIIASANLIPIDNTIIRTKCYIGKSNWISNTVYMSALLDDLMIFNKSFTNLEILRLILNI